MLFISSEVDKISGYPSSDFIQNSVRTFESVIHPDDREYCSKAVETAIQLAKPWEVEYKVLHCDGGIRWAYEKGRAITNSEGAVEYLDGFILDITERKRIDELLRESELRYKTLVETSQDGISLMDLNGVMLFVNKRKAEMVRASNEKDLIGTSAFNLLSENSRIAMGALMPQLVLQGYMDNIEADVLRCDGTIFNAEFNVKILKDSSGIPRYMMDTMRDITERKKAENALKESEFKFKSLFETSSDAIFIMDKSMYLDCNSKTSQIFGCDNYHIIGHSPLDFSPEFQPDGKSSKLKAAEKINAALNGEPQYFEWLHKKFDGTEFNAEISLNRVIIKGEYLLHAIVRDISERKRAEMALKESEELFKSIIELAPNAIVLNDSEGRYLLVNNAFAKNSGYAAEEVIGKTNKDLGLGLSPESDEIIRKELISTGSIDNLETSFQSKNGKRIDLYYSSKVIQFNNQPVILSSTIDITEKKITEKELESYRNHLEFLVTKRTEELAAANEELSATNEELFYKHKELHDALENLKNAQKQLIQSEKMASLGVLAAGVAHEINNPLNFISGGIHGIDNYIKDNLSEHTENVSPLIEAVNIGVTRAADIVKSLNRFSRQTESASEKCDLNTIINNCIVILNNQIKDRIEIRKNITNSKYILIGNEGKLHQVVLNIVTNAIQAIEKKGVITLSTIKKDQMIVLMVQDSGHGIEKEILNRIFDPFFTTKEAGKGTGLGLAICYQIIKELNGTIEVQSEVGKGTNITISLPVD